MMATIADRHGRLDVLVNNAGGSPIVDAAAASPRFSEAIIALNLTSALLVSTSAHDLLAPSPGGGTIINIAGLSGTRPSPGTAAYGAAKAGLISLTKSLAMEWEPAVRVNVVIVGLVAVDGGDEHYGGPRRARPDRQDTPNKTDGNWRRRRAGRRLSCIAAAYVSGAELSIHSGGERPAFLDLASS